MSYPPISIRCSICHLCCPRECYDLRHPGQCHDKYCVSNMPRPRVNRAQSTDYFTSSSSSDRPRFDYEEDRGYNVAYVSPPPSPGERHGKYPPSASRSAKYYDQSDDYDRPHRSYSVRRSFSTREPSVTRDRSDYREPSHRPSMKRSTSQRGPPLSRTESTGKSYSTRKPSEARVYEPERESRRSSRSSRSFAQPEFYERPRDGPEYYAHRPQRTSRSSSFSVPKAPFQYKYASTEDPDGTILDEVPPKVAPEYEDAYDRMRRRSYKHR